MDLFLQHINVPVRKNMTFSPAFMGGLIYEMWYVKRQCFHFWSE